MPKWKAMLRRRFFSPLNREFQLAPQLQLGTIYCSGYFTQSKFCPAARPGAAPGTSTRTHHFTFWTAQKPSPAFIGIMSFQSRERWGYQGQIQTLLLDTMNSNTNFNHPHWHLLPALTGSVLRAMSTTKQKTVKKKKSHRLKDLKTHNLKDRD